MASVAHPYEDFAGHDFYHAVNERLVALVDLQPGQVVVDLASGTGAQLGHILAHVQADQANGRVYALDTDAAALAVARQSYGDQGITYLVADAAELNRIPEAPDAIICGNAFHLVDHKATVLAAARRLLKPGGLFAFNTTFFEGAAPAATRSIYLTWMIKARQILRSEQTALTKGRAERSAARQQLTPGQYHRLLEEEGFLVRQMEMNLVNLPLQSIEDISSFPAFADGLGLRAPIDQTISALRRAAALCFAAHNLVAVPRRWLQVVAEGESL